MSVVQATLARIPVDLVVKNVRLADVITGEIYPVEIAIHGKTIVAVEQPGRFPERAARRTLDGAGQLAVPGLVDSHLHIESSLVTPAPFAEAALRRGVTTVAEDPHEVANATGLSGVRRFWQASQDLPLTILYLASTCVPAAAGLEHCRGDMGAEEIGEMLTWPGVIGLAEVMDARAVVDEKPRMTAILEAGREAGGLFEGHNPMLEGRELQAYIAAGVDSDHTIASPERILEKLRLGVTVQLQERYMTREIMAAIAGLPAAPTTVCLVTDDVAPDYFEDHGHLDQVLRKAIALGLPPMMALQAATINPARRLRLYDRGLIAPGRRADLVLVDALASFAVSTTIAGGQIVVADGRTQWTVPAAEPQLDGLRDSLDLPPLSPDDFRFRLGRPDRALSARVIWSHARGTTTEEAEAEVPIRDGEPDLADTDLAQIAVFARGDISRAHGFIQGLGLRQGAIATSHAHDSHNLAVIGRDRESMATAANAAIAAGGGLVVALGEQVLAMVPLPIGGILSDAPLPEVAAQMRALTAVLDGLGVRHPYLLMRLTTYTLPVSSGLRITDMGYVRPKERAIVPLWL
jgi:adenine deaminase